MKITVAGIQDIIQSYNLNNSQALILSDKIVQKVTREIYENWMDLASRNLGSTKDMYLRSLLAPQFFYKGISVTGLIVLLGQLANMIEDGAPPFDMKIGFAGSPKVKFTKNGKWFLTIPFRYGTPGSLSQNEAFHSKMPKAIYDVAKNLSATTINPAGGKKFFAYGQSLKKENIPAPHNEIKKSTHKSGQYEGMIRIEKTYNKTTSSQYMVFRRVSDNSDPSAWMHPGFRAVNFAEKAYKEVEKDMDVIVENVCTEVLNDMGVLQ